MMKTFTFVTEKTEKGMWVIMTAPSRRSQKKYFRDTPYALSATKSRFWAIEQIDVIIEHCDIECVPYPRVTFSGVDVDLSRWGSGVRIDLTRGDLL